MCVAKERQTRRISSKSKENELTKKVHVLHTRLRTTQPTKASPKRTEPVKPVEQVSKRLSATKLVRPLSRRKKIQETSSSSKIQGQKHKADTKPVKLVEQITKELPKTKLVTRKKKKGHGWAYRKRHSNSFSKRRQTTTQKMLNTDSEKMSCNWRHSLTKSEQQRSSASSLEGNKKAATSLSLLRTGSKENVIKSSHSSVMSKKPKKRPREIPTESNTKQKEGNHDNRSPSSGTEKKDKNDAKNIDGNADDGSKRRAPKRRRLSRRSDESSSSLKNWKCAFCGFGNNERFLGYLFGPYSCNVNVEEEGDNGEDKEKEMEDEKDLWMHALCAYWTPGVCLVGNEVKGLGDALTMGRKMTCQCCKSLGATLCCVVHTCKTTFHYPCAVEEDCSFNPDNFTITCSRHKQTKKD